MDKPFTGGCACGAVRYATTQSPIFQNLCHCRDCQRRSGSGHGAWMTFGDCASIGLTGQATEWQVEGDSGNTKVHAFCPQCGTPVYLRFEAMPGLLSVPATSLDEPERFMPTLVTYGVRRLNWDRIDPALPVVERMPQG